LNTEKQRPGIHVALSTSSENKWKYRRLTRQVFLTEGLEQDLNTVIGVKYGLHLALIDYIRARLHEDAGDMQRSSYFYAKFKERVQKYPYRKSGQRGIQLFGLR